MKEVTYDVEVLVEGDWVPKPGMQGTSKTTALVRRNQIDGHPFPARVVEIKTRVSRRVVNS
jgi:hypothetical protein